MGMSCREIAAGLGRSHTTISRELRRNGSASGYQSQTAQRCASRRRQMPRHYRCLSRPELVTHVDEKFCAQVGLLEYQQDAAMRVSDETIYCLINAVAEMGDMIYAIAIYTGPAGDAVPKLVRSRKTCSPRTCQYWRAPGD